MKRSLMRMMVKVIYKGFPEEIGATGIFSWGIQGLLGWHPPGNPFPISAPISGTLFINMRQSFPFLGSEGLKFLKISKKLYYWNLNLLRKINGYFKSVI